MIENLKLVRSTVWIYIVLAYVFTFSVDFFIIQGGVSVYASDSLATLRMWMPGIVGLALSWFTQREKLFALLKTIPRFRYCFLSYFLPILLGLVSLALLAASGITDLGPRADLIKKYQGLAPFLKKALLYSPTVGLISPFLACAGEELGWRGYLFPATENLNPVFRKLFNGLVWAIFHWPIMLFSDYAVSSNRFYSVVLFSVFIVAQAAIICTIQERSRSLWPSVLFHAAHNLWIIGIFPGFYISNEKTPFLIGEGGLFLAIIYVAVALGLLRYSDRHLDPIQNS